MEENEKQIIKESLRELMSKMGFDVEIDIKESVDDPMSVTCNLSTSSESNLLIGQGGVNLQALQHIARLLVRKKIQQKIRFVIDINGYRQEKNQSIIELANQAAQQAITEKRAVVLRPMSTYERRVVHLELSKNDSVVTESIGEGEGRKVVVKPAASF
jgi:spoIIIJ-associated protein